MIVALLATLLATTSAQGTDPGTLRGRVLGEESGRPLAYALLEVETTAGPLSTLTGTDGRYVLHGVPAGRWRVRASALDRWPLEVTVTMPDSGELVLEMTLRLHPVSVAGIHVLSTPDLAARPGPDTALPTARGSPGDPALRALEASPGAAELGVADAIRKDGRLGNVDTTSTLYVRGAAADLKLVLLDGAPVYAPFHLGGLMEAFQPGVLQDARLYVGGAPARFDGGLSEILDLNTRPGAERSAWSGAVDLMSARSRVEGPLGPVRFLVGGRILHSRTDAGLLEAPLPYGYADGLARLDLDLGDAGWLGATGFYNRESVRLTGVADDRELANWGNRAGSVRYRGRVAGADARLGIAAGLFETRLPLDLVVGSVGEGRSTRTRATADFGRPLGGLSLAYGVAYERERIDYRAYDSAGAAIDSLARRYTADAAGAYTEATWRPVPELQLRAGLRGNFFTVQNALRLAPRASVTWDLGSGSTLSLAVGRYYQYVRTTETILSGSLAEGWPAAPVAAAVDTAIPTDTLAPPPQAPDTIAPGGPLILRPFSGVAAATHFVLGLSHRPREDLALGVEAFHKLFHNPSGLPDLRAAGVDLWVDWARRGWAAWGGYSLAWVWTEDGTPSTTTFSGRQLLSAGLQAPLPSDVVFEVRMSSSYGLPFTAVPGPGTPSGDRTERFSPNTRGAEPPLAGAPDGSYFRLDLRLSRRWSGRLLGARFDFTPYVELLNALDQRDALFYRWDLGQGPAPRSLQAVPLLPILGVEWNL